MTHAPARRNRQRHASAPGAAAATHKGRERAPAETTGSAPAEAPTGVPEPEVEREDGMPRPPDGGWGWVVVFASFMIHIVTDGVTYSFGMFYSALVEYFHSGKGETAWIASMLVGVTLCSGPVSSSFVNKYGCRKVTIAGALLASLCLGLSALAPNIATLYVTVGLGTGLGFGLIYLPAIVSVTCYFEKYRSLATGIAVCGSGLGTFLMAPITEILIATLEWRYAILVIGIMVLSCVIFGILFKPLKADPRPQGATLSQLEEQPPHALNLSVERLRDESPSDNDFLNSMGNSTSGGKLHRPRSVGHLGPGANTTGQRLPPVPSAARLALSQPALMSGSTAGNWGHSESTTSHGLRRKGSGLMYKKDIFYSGSVLNIAQNRSVLHLYTPDNPEASRLLEHGEIVQRVHGSDSQQPQDAAAAVAVRAPGQAVEGQKRTVCGCISLSAETADTLAEMLDFSLFRDPIFILFTISNFLTSIGFNVPYLYIAVQANTRGIDEKSASYLIAIIGVGNTIGRVILGYISDKPWVNRLLIYNLCLTICGIVTAFSAFCQTFWAFAVYTFVFGFTIGAYVGLTSVILVDLLGLDKLTNAFGLLLLFQGIASLIGPPIAGWLYDGLGSYDPGFIVAGVTMGLSGIMLFVIPPVQRWQKNHQRRSQQTSGLELKSVEANGSAATAHA